MRKCQNWIKYQVCYATLGAEHACNPITHNMHYNTTRKIKLACLNIFASGNSLPPEMPIKDILMYFCYQLIYTPHTDTAITS